MRIQTLKTQPNNQNHRNHPIRDSLTHSHSLTHSPQRRTAQEHNRGNDQRRVQQLIAHPVYNGHRLWVVRSAPNHLQRPQPFHPSSQHLFAPNLQTPIRLSPGRFANSARTEILPSSSKFGTPSTTWVRRKQGEDSLSLVLLDRLSWVGLGWNLEVNDGGWIDEKEEDLTEFTGMGGWQVSMMKWSFGS